MRKYLINIVIIVIVLLFLSGCWDSKDIQQKDIHIAQVIDYKDGKYTLFGEVADLSGKSQKSESKSNKSQPFHILEGTGESLTQARDELERKSSMPIYLGANRVLTFTDRMASKGLEEYLNRARTQHDTRKSVRIITTSVDPKELLNAKTDNSASVGFAIDKMMESKVAEGSSFEVDIGSLLEALAVKKIGFLIPEIDIKDSDLTFTGYSVFKDTKKIGFIPAETRMGTVLFLKPKARFSYEIKTDSGKYTIETVLKDKKIKTHYENNQLNIKVNMSFTAELSYAEKKRTISNSEINELHKILEQMLKRGILQALETSQKAYGIDYLGIYRYFKASYGNYFNTINWEEIYCSANMDAEAEVTISASELPQK